jgi:hypothetical protein
MICVSGIMQQDNNEQVILEPKLIAKQYIRSNPFLANKKNFCLIFLFWKQGSFLFKKSEEALFWYSRTHDSV